MKNSIWSGWLVALFLALACGPAAAQTRVATVDLRKVFDGYWKTKQADAALKDRAAELDKEYKALRDDYEKLKQEYQKLRAESEDQAVAAEERDRRKQAAEAKLKTIKESEDAIMAFERRARATLDEQQRRMRDGIIEEIRNVITARAKSSGYGVVLDTSAQTPNLTPIILYYDPEQDITMAVLKQLKLGAPPEFSRGAARPPAEPRKEEKK
jgi:outer membrane protein